ncbi:SprB-like repeat protein, partial [Aquimarina brevivitae]
MKKILLIGILLMGITHTSAQDDYTISINGNVGRGDRCGSGGDGMQRVTLLFESGARRVIHDASGFHNTSFTFTETFSDSNKVTGIEVYSTGRDDDVVDCKTDRATKTVSVSTEPCSYRIYNKDELFVRRIRSGRMIVRVFPNIDLQFTDGTLPTEINTTCLSDAVTITADKDYLPTEIYTWEFFDEINLDVQTHPDLRALEQERDRARGNYTECVRTTGDPDRCIPQERALDEAQQAVNNYTGPRTILVPIWREITSKSEQPTIQLRATDLYSDQDDLDELVGRNVQIRMVNCSWGSPLTNVLNVRFLPDAPSVSGPPVVTPPTCSYDEFNNIRIPFADGINSNQKISISLKRLADGQSPYTNADSASSLGITDQQFNTRVNNRYPVEYKNVVNVRNANLSAGSYNWNLNAASDPDAFVGGYYALIVTSYETSDTGNNNPSCVPQYYFFEVQAPPALEWATSTITDQQCYGVNDGSFQLNVTAGNAPYRYSLDGGSYQTMSGSSVTITNLSPGDHTIRVIDANGCENRNYTSGTTTVRISGLQAPISHNVPTNRIQNPTRPGATDGRIEVVAINGGTPSTSFGYRYWVYRNNLAVASYQNLTSQGNFLLSGLSAGRYTVRYQDGNGCEITLPLAELTDPVPITFTVQNTPATCDVSDDGRITITNVGGAPGPYTYRWFQNGTQITGEISNTIIRGTGTGYTVEINSPTGFGTRQNITIGTLPQVNVSSVSIPDLLCYDGTTTATVTATGGSGSYEYGIWNGVSTIWQASNQFTLPYAASGYRFVVRDAAASVCTSTPSGIYTPARPAELFINSNTIINNTIFGGSTASILINVVGGTGDLTYQWSRENDNTFTATTQNISNLSAGRYTVSISDANGCSTQGVFEVTQPDRLETSTAVTQQIDCFEGVGSLRASVQGGLLDQSGQYRYQWAVNENGAFNPINGATLANLTNVPAGTYQVQVWDDYTSTSAIQVLSQPNVLTLSLTKTDANCYAAADGTITLNIEGGTAPYFYSLDGSTYTPVSDLSSNTITGLVAQDYQVWLRDSNGCTIDRPQEITIDQPVAITITLDNREPATTVGGTNGALDITADLGVAPYSYQWTLAEDGSFSATSEDLTGVGAGNYTVVVTDANGCTATATYEVIEPAPMEVSVEITIPI